MHESMRQKTATRSDCRVGVSAGVVLVAVASVGVGACYAVEHVHAALARGQDCGENHV